MSGYPNKILIGASAATAAAILAGCGGGSSSTPAASSSSSANPATKFSTANISGLGSVVVDGRGRTVYILTSGGHTNVPCTASNGCTKLWPTLPLPAGTSATAGTGVKASLLGTKKLSDGKSYPTYNGWLIYEYAGDPGPDQAKGQRIKSFGGTWYVLSASGTPVTSSASTSGTTTSGGYQR